MSVVKGVFRASRSIGRALAAVARWSFAYVEDDEPVRTVGAAGPAHGPVPAIWLRLDRRERRQDAR